MRYYVNFKQVTIFVFPRVREFLKFTLHHITCNWCAQSQYENPPHWRHLPSTNQPFLRSVWQMITTSLWPLTCLVFWACTCGNLFPFIDIPENDVNRHWWMLQVCDTAGSKISKTQNLNSERLSATHFVAIAAAMNSQGNWKKGRIWSRGSG